jgi:ABC-2 type transport system ATP-binding protein
VIEVKNVSRRYGETLAVNNVSFTVQRGEVVGFLGPNGAGKTTTMRMITGFLPASEGRIAVAGHDVEDAPLEARRAVGYLPESPPLYPEMRVADFVAYVAALKDVPRAERAAKVEKALGSCGLGDVARKVIGTLSKGYRQRVGLAQAIVHEPAVLVLDEPTSGLDPMQIVEIRDLIQDLADAEGRTVILSTHILPEVEAICRRVLLISGGQIRIDGALEEVKGGSTLEDVYLREAAAPAPAPASAASAAPDGAGPDGAPEGEVHP